MLASLTARKEWKFFAVLGKAAPALAAGWWTVLLLRGILPAAFAIAMGVLVGAVQARSFAYRPAHLWLRHLRPAPGAQPHSPGAQRQPRRPHRGLALRPVDRSLCAPARHRTPRRSYPDRGPHRGPRLRPGHDRAAALHLHGFHREWISRDDRRHCFRRHPLALRLVGSAAAGRRLAGHALAAARERRLARPPKSRSPRGSAGRRLRLPAGRRSAGQQGVAPVRPGSLDD